MRKATLVFSTHESLWLFHGQSRAINVAVRPRTNTLTGLFTPGEIESALEEFGASELSPDEVANGGPVLLRGETERNVWRQL